MTQRQHFVPEAYLKRFTRDSNGFFFKASHKPKFSQIKNRPISRVCFYDDFYKLKQPEVLRDRTILEDLNFIEKNAFSYESSLNEILDSIAIGKNSIPFIKAKQLIEIILKLKHRNPAYRDSFKKEHANTEKTKEELNRHGEILKESLLKSTNYPEELLQTIVDKSKANILVDENFHVEAHKRVLIDTYLGDNEAMDDAMKAILKLGIAVLRPINPNSYFITSDNPGFSLLGDKVFNTNYGNFDRVGFPIGSKVAVLFGGSDISFNQQNRNVNSLSMTDEQMEIFNFCTIFNCFDALFCEDKDYLKNLIDRFTATQKFLS